MTAIRRGFLVFASAILLVQVAAGGELNDFEQTAGEDDTPSNKTTRSRTHGYHTSEDDHDSGFFGNLMGDLVWGVVTSPFRFWFDDSAASYTYNEGTEDEGWAVEVIPDSRHRLGEAALPFVRADYNWQYISSDLDAQDIRLEAGYKLLAFHGRYTRYEEHHPADALTLNQYYGVLRVGGAIPEGTSNVRAWEFGLGLGGVQQKGNKEYSSAAFTLPIKIYPADWLGIEFKPAWYRPQEKTIGDYDLSASVGWRGVHLRGGYRWLWMQGEGSWLDGPYAGISLSF